MAVAHNRVPITVRLEPFEGPLDLLLYLIQSHDLDISRISLSQVTDQYLIYIRLMQDLNFDVAGDFLLMAATLIKWKSEALLPQEKQVVDPNAEDDGPTPEELIRRLLEHRRFLAAGEDLAALPQLHDHVFARPNLRAPIHRIWRDMDINGLALSYQDAIAKERRRSKVLRKETVSIAGKIQQMAEILEIDRLTPLKDTYGADAERGDVVVSFLASLELSRLRKMKVFQEGYYQEIFIKLIESLKNFDLSFASGFDAEEINKETPAPAPAVEAAEPVQ